MQLEATVGRAQRCAFVHAENFANINNHLMNHLHSPETFHNSIHALHLATVGMCGCMHGTAADSGCGQVHLPGFCSCLMHLCVDHWHDPHIGLLDHNRYSVMQPQGMFVVVWHRACLCFRSLLPTVSAAGLCRQPSHAHVLAAAGRLRLVRPGPRVHGSCLGQGRKEGGEAPAQYASSRHPVPCRTSPGVTSAA